MSLQHDKKIRVGGIKIQNRVFRPDLRDVIPMRIKKEKNRLKEMYGEERILDLLGFI